MKSKTQKLAELYDKCCEADDLDHFFRVFKRYKLTEDELRQFIYCGGDKAVAINIVFWKTLYDKVYSVDFMREMFLHCTKKDKQFLEDVVRDHLSFIMQDLNPEESNVKYAQKILDDKIALLNIRNYLTCCEPKDKSLIDDYNFYPENLQNALCGCQEQSEEIRTI